MALGRQPGSCGVLRVSALSKACGEGWVPPACFEVLQSGCCAVNLCGGMVCDGAIARGGSFSQKPRLRDTPHMTTAALCRTGFSTFGFGAQARSLVSDS